MKNNTGIASIFAHLSLYYLGGVVTKSPRTADANGPLVSARVMTESVCNTGVCEPTG